MKAKIFLLPIMVVLLFAAPGWLQRDARQTKLLEFLDFAKLTKISESPPNSPKENALFRRSRGNAVYEMDGFTFSYSALPVAQRDWIEVVHVLSKKNAMSAPRDAERKLGKYHVGFQPDFALFFERGREEVAAMLSVSSSEIIFIGSLGTSIVDLSPEALSLLREILEKYRFSVPAL